MKVIMKKLEPPPVEEWDLPYFMLFHESEGGSDPDRLMSINGTFPVFATKEDAELVIEALRESVPDVKLVPVTVQYGIAAASEIKYGKPVEFVKPHQES